MNLSLNNFAFLQPYYLWIKAFHMVSIVAWMAGIFYMPRLLVYHTQAQSKGEASSFFEIMEKRLYKIIMVPAMHLSLVLGIILAIIPDVINWSSGWLHVKLLCVLALIFFQYQLNRWRQELAQGSCTKSTRFFRVINEIPTLLLIIICICVIVKPF